LFLSRSIIISLSSALRFLKIVHAICIIFREDPCLINIFWNFACKMIDFVHLLKNKDVACDIFAHWLLPNTWCTHPFSLSSGYIIMYSNFTLHNNCLFSIQIFFVFVSDCVLIETDATPYCFFKLAQAIGLIEAIAKGIQGTRTLLIMLISWDI